MKRAFQSNPTASECLNETYTKPVTCRKGLKVPFTGTGHNCYSCNAQQNTWTLTIWVKPMVFMPVFTLLYNLCFDLSYRRAMMGVACKMS